MTNHHEAPMLDPQAMLTALRTLGFHSVVEPTEDGEISTSQAGQIAGSLHCLTEVTALQYASEGSMAHVSNGMMSILIASTGGTPYAQKAVSPEVTTLWMALLSDRIDMMREQLINMCREEDTTARAVILGALQVASYMATFTGMGIGGELLRSDAKDLVGVMELALRECQSDLFRLRKKLRLDVDHV